MTDDNDDNDLLLDIRPRYTAGFDSLCPACGDDIEADTTEIVKDPHWGWICAACADED